MMRNEGKAAEEKAGVEINCLFCRHFFITHEAGFPYGCRAAGFKSRSMPSREMLLNSGIVCQIFAEKEKIR